jgi:hypothetical protein
MAAVLEQQWPGYWVNNQPTMALVLEKHWRLYLSSNGGGI